MIDVLVIGGGHAGVEAACAASRSGVSVMLVTQDRSKIGAMSCNPSIGGVGKGHIVREVDALDGVMAIAADAAAIHHRILNASKGSAVHGPRIQADRALYAAAVQREISAARVEVVAGEVVDIVLRTGRAAGVRLASDEVITAKTVILATGTFLGGKLFRGGERYDGGRIDERPALPLARHLRSLGLVTGRLKTGTPPRLDGRTIDWSQLTMQPSDCDHWTMSSMTPYRRLPQLACAITRTTPVTHDVIREGSARSPLVGGEIEGAGPRYCPSIEDKVRRFGDRDGHQLFLEPEGLDSPIVYPNGISTSLPTDIQQNMIASVPGLERAAIVVPGYAVEYDYLDPRGLSADLSSRAIPGLYCAGQVNGTTGYEEAAGQGLIAGINAAAEVLGRAPLILDRASSYLGVMIDDLTLQGVTEPYRMLTARAEYRLSLRADNAEQRLSDLGADMGCLGPVRRQHADLRQQQRATARSSLAVRVDTGCTGSQDKDRVLTLGEWLCRDDADQMALHAMIAGPTDIVAEIATDARYRPYVERQTKEIEQLRRHERQKLPIDLSFAAIPGLSTEMVERLTASRPTSLAAASRLRGITPAALSAILLYTRRQTA